MTREINQGGEEPVSSKSGGCLKSFILYLQPQKEKINSIKGGKRTYREPQFGFHTLDRCRATEMFQRHVAHESSCMDPSDWTVLFLTALAVWNVNTAPLSCTAVALRLINKICVLSPVQTRVFTLTASKCLQSVRCRSPNWYLWSHLSVD